MKPATEPPGRRVTDRRREVALAGHAGELDVVRRGLVDDAAVVRTTALGALARLGELRERDLAAALADPAPEVRRRACELAAGLDSVDLVSALGDPDDSVVEAAAWASGERGGRTSTPTRSALSSVARGHRDPLCREAAVAALGAIGDRAGLDAVLAALEDKPAIRRRAAAALAAFDDPIAEDGLRRCLGDRDWQVRQIAEDLLDD